MPVGEYLLKRARADQEGMGVVAGGRSGVARSPTSLFSRSAAENVYKLTNICISKLHD